MGMRKHHRKGAVATCAKCNAAKAVTEFSKSTKSKTGLQSWCRSCQQQYDAARRAGAEPTFHRHRAKSASPAVVYKGVRKVAVRPRATVVARFAVQASTLQPVVQVIGGSSAITLDLECARRLRRDLDGILAGL